MGDDAGVTIVVACGAFKGSLTAIESLPSRREGARHAHRTPTWWSVPSPTAAGAASGDGRRRSRPVPVTASGRPGEGGDLVRRHRPGHRVRRDGRRVRAAASSRRHPATARGVQPRGRRGHAGGPALRPWQHPPGHRRQRLDRRRHRHAVRPGRAVPRLPRQRAPRRRRLTSAPGPRRPRRTRPGRAGRPGPRGLRRRQSPARPLGAARVYGPRRAPAREVDILEAGLARLVEVLRPRDWT